MDESFIATAPRHLNLFLFHAIRSVNNLNSYFYSTFWHANTCAVDNTFYITLGAVDC
jgi:hypothetical protein